MSKYWVLCTGIAGQFTTPISAPRCTGCPTGVSPQAPCIACADNRRCVLYRYSCTYDALRTPKDILRDILNNKARHPVTLPTLASRHCAGAVRRTSSGLQLTHVRTSENYKYSDLLIRVVDSYNSAALPIKEGIALFESGSI